MKLQLENIQKSFDNKEVLKDITFEFEKEKIYALLGRNGAGKTTLFNILADEIKEDSGNVSLATSEGTRSLEIEDLSYVYSTPVLPDFLTGYEFIRFFMASIRTRFYLEEPSTIILISSRSTEKTATG